MTNLHIQYFLEVARLNSFTKAAEKLYVAQPSISRQISNLEHELGVALFDRTKSTIQLTEAGKIMFHFFEETQDAFHKNLELAKLSTQAFSGTIKVGFPSYFNKSALWDHVHSAFVSNFPNIQLQLYMFPIRILLDKINNNELDIVLCYDDYLNNNPSYNMIHVLNAPGYVFYHRNNPLCNRENLSLHDFQNQTLYTLPASEDPYCKKSMLRFCREQNIIPATIYEVTNTETLLFTLSRGDGYTLFANWLQPLDDPSYQKIPINHIDSMSLFWKKKNDSKLLSLFANEFQFWAQSEQ